MTVCVVGGGLMGMALARKIAQDGIAVDVIERDSQVGGLATWHDFGGFFWDRFYHVILPSDRQLIALVNDLGLADELQWRRTRTGFFVDGQLHSISSNVEFLRFPYLSLFAKGRLAWTMLYGSRISDWKRLERISAEDWLMRVSGKDTYTKIWRPLLLAKLGSNYKRVSAVFIWSYIKRLFSARDKSASAEHLGHVSGGYRMIFDRLRQEIETAGGCIQTGFQVDEIKSTESNKLSVTANGTNRTYDRVVCTSPVSVLRSVVTSELMKVEPTGKDVEYLGVICMVVISRTPIVPYYVVNIADSQIAFTGLIGMSTVVDTENTGGYYLTYLPRYVLSTDEELRTSDAEIERQFLQGLRKVAPDFDESDIVSIHINRAYKVQPLQVLDYSNIVPSVTTQHPNFFVLNTSQFVNATLNNNEVVRAVDDFYLNVRNSFVKNAD